MSSSSKTTTDHKEIRHWAEARGGKPATVKGTEEKGEEAGILRINFPGYAEAKLQDISWDDFFQKFDEKGLAFVYQDKTAEGEESRFFKLVSRENQKKSA